jgi:hypothetical protein
LTVLALSALILVPISADATVYVILLDEREIAIASDGNWLVVSGESSRPASQIKEKVIRLSPALAFMCDGLTEIDTTTVKVHAADLAKQLNHGYQSQGGSKHMMAVLAGAFGQVMSDRLNQMSPEQRNQIFAARQQLATPGGHCSSVYSLGLTLTTNSRSKRWTFSQIHREAKEKTSAIT